MTPAEGPMNSLLQARSYGSIRVSAPPKPRRTRQRVSRAITLLGPLVKRDRKGSSIEEAEVHTGD
jgi:hypothetical protein